MGPPFDIDVINLCRSPAAKEKKKNIKKVGCFRGQIIGVETPSRLESGAPIENAVTSRMQAIGATH